MNMGLSLLYLTRESLFDDGIIHGQYLTFGVAWIYIRDLEINIWN